MWRQDRSNTIRTGPGWVAGPLGTARASRSRAPRALLALGIALGAAACGESGALTELRATAAAFDGRALGPRARGAWHRLASSSWYGGVTNIWTWGPHDVAVDACTLWHAGERDALIHLALEAEPAGQLWAMSALQHLDGDAFDALAPEFLSATVVVKTMDGCIAGRGPLGEIFRDRVVGDEELEREYDDLFARTADPEELVTRSRRQDGWWLDTPLAEAAAEALAAADQVGDTTCPLARELDTLLEEEPLPYAAGLRLALSPRPEARYWGAWVLREVSPPAFDALRPTWEADDSPVTCRTAQGSEQHTLAEAIARHLN